MRVLVAPDSFKGSLSAEAAARAMAEGLRSRWPEVAVRRLPLADGGEGTLAALAAARPGAELTCPALGPHGEALQAGWWRGEDGLGVVELARASGLLVTRRRAPLQASSVGTGQLLAVAAADPAVARLLLAVGGSATVDGGAGALAALGFELLDAADAPVPASPAGLLRLARIRPPAALPPRLAGLEVLCDVDSPLLGPAGAASVFGPQKGATPDEVGVLEAALARFAGVLASTFGRDPRAVAGAGAAGGLAGGLYAALDARLVGGFEQVAELVGLDEALAEVALVLTGEGRLDAQTGRGKVVAGLARRAQARGAAVWAFAGEVTPAGEDWCAAAGVAVASIAPGPLSRAECVASGGALLRRAVARAAGFGRPPGGPAGPEVRPLGGPLVGQAG